MVNSVVFEFMVLIGAGLEVWFGLPVMSRTARLAWDVVADKLFHDEDSRIEPALLAKFNCDFDKRAIIGCAGGLLIMAFGGTSSFSLIACCWLGGKVLAANVKHQRNLQAKKTKLQVVSTTVVKRRHSA